jgi:hypothetical protein
MLIQLELPDWMIENPASGITADRFHELAAQYKDEPGLKRFFTTTGHLLEDYHKNRTNQC